MTTEKDFFVKQNPRWCFGNKQKLNKRATKTNTNHTFENFENSFCYVVIQPAILLLPNCSSLQKSKSKF